MINPGKKKNHTLIDKLIRNGKIYTDKEHISQAMNEYFCNIGTDLQSKLSVTNISYEDFLPDRILPSFFICPITNDDILLEIRKMDPKKSAGADNIGPKVLKMCPEIFAKNLTKIFNHAIEMGEYPHELKLAKVIALFKKGNRQDPTNYRPISLLSIFNKIFEKHLCKQLLNFLNKNHVLYPYQFGFRKLYSTIMALIDFTDNVRDQLDLGNYVLSIFVDLTKAFDTVDHDILLHKLDRYGVRGHANEFFKSYLTNRKQYTIVNGVKSDIQEIRCGVPQGSVLGPLLFLIYVNDIHRSVPLSKVQLFADDTSLSLYDNNLERLISKSKDQFSKLYSWCVCNKLTINTGKTNFILFHTKNKFVPQDFNNIRGSDFNIKRSESVKYIGLHIDEKLNWGTHIDTICTSLIKYFGIFNHIKHLVSKTLIRQIYFAFVYSRINYGIEIYGSCSKKLLSKLQTIQNKLIKLFVGHPRLTPTNYIHHDLRILKVEDIYKTNVLNFVNNCLMKNCPTIFDNYFQIKQSTHRTRSEGSILIKRTRTVLGSLRVKSQGAKLWNNLDNGLHQYRLKKCFKKYCTRHCIGLYKV